MPLHLLLQCNINFMRKLHTRLGGTERSECFLKKRWQQTMAKATADYEVKAWADLGPTTSNRHCGYMPQQKTAKYAGHGFSGRRIFAASEVATMHNLWAPKRSMAKIHEVQDGKQELPTLGMRSQAPAC